MLKTTQKSAVLLVFSFAFCFAQAQTKCFIPDSVWEKLNEPPQWLELKKGGQNVLWDVCNLHTELYNDTLYFDPLPYSTLFGSTNCAFGTNNIKVMPPVYIVIDGTGLLKKDTVEYGWNGYGFLKNNLTQYQIAKRFFVRERIEITDTASGSKWFGTTESYYWFNSGQIEPLLIAHNQIIDIAGFTEEFKRIETRNCPFYQNLSNVELAQFITQVNLNCSPNPTSQNISVSYKMPADGNVQLYLENILTKSSVLIYSQFEKQGSQLHYLDLNNFINGTYYVKLVINNIPVSQPIVLTK